MSNTIPYNMSQHDCVQKSEFKHIKESIASILKDLNGNGRPGLKEKVNKMETLFQSQVEKQDEYNTEMKNFHTKVDDFISKINTIYTAIKIIVGSSIFGTIVSYIVMKIIN